MPTSSTPDQHSTKNNTAQKHTADGRTSVDKTLDRSFIDQNLQQESDTENPDPKLAGTYMVTLDSPMGTQKVKTVLHTDGTTMTGSMNVMGKRVEILDGRATEEGFSCRVIGRVLFKKVEGFISGVRDGSTVRGVIKSSVGNFEFSGSRVED